MTTANEINVTLTEEDVTDILASKEGLHKQRIKYKELEGRHNPFDFDLIRTQIATKMYSPFLNIEITNVEQACWHAEYVVKEWAKEDILAAAERAKEANRIRQRNYQDKKRKEHDELFPELVQAREALKKAKEDRLAAIAQWDAYIVSLKKAMNVRFGSISNE